MDKRTVPALVDYMADAFGLEPSAERSRARRIREAGFLSQLGHGRGAAIATSKDAAMLLLVSAAGPVPLHAAAMAAAFDACRFNWEDLEGKTSAVDQVAAVIDENDDKRYVRITMEFRLSVEVFDTTNAGGGFLKYKTADDNEAWRKLSPIYGDGASPKPRPGFQRRVEIPGWMLQEVGFWLRGEDGE